MTSEETAIASDFLSGPSQDLVLKTLLQLGKLKGMISLFGPYAEPTGKPSDDDQRWADYQRFDWSIRQLPAICVYESESPEQKDSDNAFLRGMVRIMVIWPPNFRRADSRRVEVGFKGAMQNFFSSQYVRSMLDELYYIQRPEKVAGLNEYGKTMTWTPNTHTIIESEACPVTIMDANYRIDLRSWYRALEFQDRTKDNPFERTLADLTEIGGAVVDPEVPPGAFQGVEDDNSVIVEIPDRFEVSNP